MLKAVNHAFLRKHYVDIGYNSDVFDLSVFLLCFFEPCKAWYMLCFFFENVIPKWAHPAAKGLNDNTTKWFCSVLRDHFSLETN